MDVCISMGSLLIIMTCDWPIAYWDRDSLPLMNRMTDRQVKNLTLPQLRFRTVIDDKHQREFSLSCSLWVGVNTAEHECFYLMLSDSLNATSPCVDAQPSLY